MRYIAIFRSSRDVIRCDKRCKAETIEVKIVTVPEKFSSSCGMSIEFEEADKERFEKIIDDLEIEVLIYDKQQI